MCVRVLLHVDEKCLEVRSYTTETMFACASTYSCMIACDDTKSHPSTAVPLFFFVFAFCHMRRVVTI